MESNSNCDATDADGEGPTENSEEQPLRPENGMSNGNGDGYTQLTPVKKKKRLPPRFEMDEETQNWRRNDSSPSPSPTSSPFKKKLVFTMPGIMRPKQPRENKLRAFVVFMFFVIVLMMSLTYVYHQQHLLKMMQLAVDERIKFTEDNRLLQLSNDAKQEILTGRLGASLITEDLPVDCLEDSRTSENETACLEWSHIARMKVFRVLMTDSAKCYTVSWQALQDGLSLKDCFSLADAHWYGVGEFTPQLWPMDLIETNATPFVTGNITNDTFGHILEGYWITSRGAAVMANLSQPLHVVFDKDVVSQLCLLSKSTSQKRFPKLQYTLCTSWDVREVHRHVIEMIRPKSQLPKDGMFAVENIVWSTRQRFGNSINEDILFNLTDELQEVDPTITGTIIIDGHWQTTDGDFAFDPRYFSNPGETLSMIHNRGYRVVLNVHPYISTQSKNYYKHLLDGFWLRDITGHVPNLVHWGHVSSAVMIDFTNDRASDWFRKSLDELRRKFHISSFQFRGGETTSLPPYATFHQPLQSRNGYSQMYNRVAISENLAFSVGVVSQFPQLSSFVELSPRQSTWDINSGLRSVIPAILSAGLVGSPFILAGPVGGEASLGRPHSELFVRWLQLATFLPVLEMSILPSSYGDEVAFIARKMFQLRKHVVMPKLKAAIAEAETSGFPIIRPLWWIAPNDTDAQNIDSEFLVGNDLLVAPILEPHGEQRDIYLPPGLWADRENNPHKGGKWIYDYRSSLSKIAYFTRIQDTRVYA